MAHQVDVTAANPANYSRSPVVGQDDVAGNQRFDRDLSAGGPNTGPFGEARHGREGQQCAGAGIQSRLKGETSIVA